MRTRLDHGRELNELLYFFGKLWNFGFSKTPKLVNFGRNKDPIKVSDDWNIRESIVVRIKKHMRSKRWIEYVLRTLMSIYGGGLEIRFFVRVLQVNTKY